MRTDGNKTICHLISCAFIQECQLKKKIHQETIKQQHQQKKPHWSMNNMEVEQHHGGSHVRQWGNCFATISFLNTKNNNKMKRTLRRGIKNSSDSNLFFVLCPFLWRCWSNEMHSGLFECFMLSKSCP